MRQLTLASVVVLVCLGACSSVEEPAYVGDPQTGRDVAERLCASCHAIGPTGESPNSSAPPLRNILAGYGEDRLAKDLERSVSISHLRMPTFYFGEHHAIDLVAYIKTIQPAGTSSSN